MKVALFRQISSHPNDSSDPEMPGYFCNIQLSQLIFLNRCYHLSSQSKNMLASTQAGGEV